MKKIIILIAAVTIFTACNDLNLNPLSQGSSENWNSNESEINMSLNGLYRSVFWAQDHVSWTDDYTNRNNVSTITGGTINGEWGTSGSMWTLCYKAISRANSIILSLDRAKDVLSPEILTRYYAEAYFVRASMYSMLISHFGDVVYFTEPLDLEESFTLSRTDKQVILESIYADYDIAMADLPESYGSNEVKRATKGTAMGMKARIALYNGDWAIARDAAEACMDLGVYTLYPDFGEMFLSKTKNPNEVLFSMPRSIELNAALDRPTIVNSITRNAGGWGAYNPSWDLFCSFLCTDGLPIDESSLFNPQEPFKNRDPRCTETIAEFQKEYLGYMYQPHPDTLQIFNFKTGKYQYNNDTRGNKQYASYNAMIWKKWIDEDWSDDKQTDVDKFILRYADVLLMYAEASIELGQIDQNVLDAINTVRARAYKVSKDQTGDYPAVTTTNKVELRRIVRTERRMELAWEGLRYMDIIRWGIADKVLNTKIYGMLNVAELREKVTSQGLWFFPMTPEIDEDGVPNFDALHDAGYIRILAERKFDASRQYLWPIPTKEILINENLTQNPGY